MTGGEQSGEGFRGEENPEVGDEEVEQGEGQPAHLHMLSVLSVRLINIIR